MRVKTIITAAAMLISISAMASEPISERVYDAGVSRELAKWRKATINDVRYELHFDLVNNIGSATIGFEVEAPPRGIYHGYVVCGFRRAFVRCSA